jgi:hypothetical protein
MNKEPALTEKASATKSLQNATKERRGMKKIL